MAKSTRKTTQPSRRRTSTPRRESKQAHRPRRTENERRASERGLSDPTSPLLEDETVGRSPSLGSAPVTLEPQQSIRLRSWSERPTMLHVENDSGYVAALEMRWGRASEEFAHCEPGMTEFSRSFEGLPVYVTNTGNVPILVATY